MNKSFAVLICMFLMGLNLPIPAQPTPQQSESPMTTPAEEEPILDFRGTVILNNANEDIILKEDTHYLAVKITKEHWKLGIARGCEIDVKGVMDYKGLVGNEVKAKSIQIVSKSKETGAGLGMRTVGDILDVFNENEIILTRGVITNLTHKSMEISELRRGISVPFSKSDPLAYFQMGEEVIVLGVIKTLHGQRMIDPIMLKSVAALLRKDIGVTPLKIHAVLEKKPVGKTIKTTGRTALFIGRSQESLLCENEDSLVIYPSDQYATLPIPVGAEVTVVGVYSTEKRDNLPVGVLREARIDRFSFAR